MDHSTPVLLAANPNPIAPGWSPQLHDHVPAPTAQRTLEALREEAHLHRPSDVSARAEHRDSAFSFYTRQQRYETHARGQRLRGRRLHVSTDVEHDHGHRDGCYAVAALHGVDGWRFRREGSGGRNAANDSVATDLPLAFDFSEMARRWRVLTRHGIRARRARFYFLGALVSTARWA